MLDNLINGNLKTAKLQARRFSWERIYKFLFEEMAWSPERSQSAADYLKGRVSFQQYCDFLESRLGQNHPAIAALSET